jgi:hypothetical protein
VTQSTSEIHEDTLSTLGENVHIVDPFQTFAKYLGATIATPGVHTLNQWLAGTLGARLSDHFSPPKGTWILCGFGRMGRWLQRSMEKQGIATVIIEPDPSLRASEASDFVAGRATQENLLQAGIQRAAGIVACTDNDSDNLSIVLNAKALNSKIFCIVRQNRYRNQVVFQAANADFIMMPSLTSARRILLLLIAPMMKTFFEGLRAQQRSGEVHAIESAIQRLESAVGGSQPRIWTAKFEEGSAKALTNWLSSGRKATLADVLRDPRGRSEQISCVPLVLRSGAETSILPPLSTPLRYGDEVLFCGDQAAPHDLDVSLNNEYVLAYLITGIDPPRSWLMAWLERKLSPTAVDGPHAS